MNNINQSRTPQNLVANIVDKTVYLEYMTSRMIVVAKELGAFQTNYGSELVWLIECSDKDVLIKTLLELNQLGFIFAGGTSGYSAGDIFSLILEKRGLSVKFKEIWSRRPGDWYIIER